MQQRRHQQQQQQQQRQTNATASPMSLLAPIGYQDNDCGYCKAKHSSQRAPITRASYYVMSKSLSPIHYQDLVDRGWRRSGSLLYLPDVARSCCPHYTIRLPVADFKPSRDQRQALHRWNRFVLGEDYTAQLARKYPQTKQEKKQARNAFDLCSAVHESESENLTPDIGPAHGFEVVLDEDTFTDEKFALFQNYQQHVHQETPAEITRSGFRRFLCSSPLHRRHSSDGERVFGTFHQCYRLDGRLIAMGVLDLLPHAVSGVYFIYHSEFEKWSMGKLSALREATLALERNYGYYYMGYYIHSNKKMRYKADYKPQYVLDLNDFGWNELNDEMTDLMCLKQYASPALERRWRELSDEQTLAMAKAESTDPEPEHEPDSIKFPSPVDAVESRLSLFDLGMPGFTPLEQLKHEVALDLIKVYLDRNNTIFTHLLTVWDQGSETDMTSIKGIIAEFAAAIGPKLANQVMVDFSRSG